MNLFEKIMVFLDSDMVEPTPYGWFHIMMVIVMTLFCIFLCKKYKKGEDKDVKTVLLILSILCLVFEVYKQLNFSFNYDVNGSYFKYQWYAFPYQFCSTPMYIALIAALIKKGKLQNSLFAFLATYGVIGGLSAMIYPATVFIDTIGINIQTMVHHGSMVIMGIYLLYVGRVKLNKEAIIGAFKVFFTLSLIALFIDIVTYYIDFQGGFEFFFISPFHVSELPVFNIIYTKVPYIVFLLIYYILFCFGSYLVLLVNKLIRRKHV